MPSVLKEGFATLTNLEIRRDKATQLNEMAADELRRQMAENWGDEVASRLSVNYLTIEYIECSDKTLRAQWAKQVEEDAKRTTTEMESKTQSALHAQQRAAVDAAAARRLAEAEAAAAVRAVENQAIIDAAEAQAEASRIKAKQALAAATAQGDLVRSNPANAAHHEALEGLKALGQNTKVFVVPSESGGLASLVQSF